MSLANQLGVAAIATQALEAAVAWWGAQPQDSRAAACLRKLMRARGQFLLTHGSKAGLSRSHIVLH